MRTHSTRAKPMSISRAVRNGNASLDRSTDVSDCSSSRDRGPCTLSCAKPDVTSVTKACASPDVPPHPGLDVAVRGVGGDHPEPLVVELGDGEVGLERAALVEPLRVGDDARLAVDVVGRDAARAPRPASRPCTRNLDMNDMSMTITPSRAARCSAAQYGRTSSGRPHVSGPGSGVDAPGRRTSRRPPSR